MRITLAAIIAAAACLIPWRANAAPCSYTFNGTLAANSTTTVNVPALNCAGANYVRMEIYKPKNRELNVKLQRDTEVLLNMTVGESETYLAGYGDYPTTDYSGLSVVLTNNGSRMRNVKIVVKAYTQS